MAENNKTVLVDVKFNVDRDEKTGNITGCYASLTYTHENDHRIEETHIPKVQIPIPIDNLSIDIERPDCDFAHPLTRDSFNYYTKCSINGFVDGVPSRMKVIYTDGIFYREKIIKEKSVKMTVEEIEKKLGYSIEIVSDKKKKK